MNSILIINKSFLKTSILMKSALRNLLKEFLKISQEILPLTWGNTAVIKMGELNGQNTELRLVFKVFTFWLFSGAFSWFQVGGELWEGLYQRVVMRKEGCCHPPFITPILRANTTHKPCCPTAWVAPRSCWRRYRLRGWGWGVWNAKNKNHHQGSVGQSFLLSPFSLPLLSTEMDCFFA